MDAGVRVLVADDERLLADTVAEGLRRLSMAVDVVYDGDSALERLGVNRYDVAVLDRDMPGRTGDEVCRRIAGVRHRHPGAAADRRRRHPRPRRRARPRRRRLPDQAVRVRRAGRPAAGAGPASAPALPPVLEQDGIVLDVTRHTAARDGLLLDLSPKEFAVLHVLMRADGRVVSAEDLLEQAWDEHADPFTNTVRVTVMTLRRKLGDPPVIHTVPRVGYRLGA